MQLRELEIFNAVMRAGTTIAAAELLAISQPGVSKAVKHLESQIGVQLFIRVGGRLSPTPEAQLLYRHVRNVFARLEAINRITKDLRGCKTGVISVASTPTLASSLLAKAVVRFRAGSPDTQIIFRSLTSHDVARRVSGGEADFGIVHSPVDCAGLEIDDLMASEVVCIVRRDHPLSSLSTVSLEDLLPYPLISYRPGTRTGTRIEAGFRAAGLTKEVGLQTSLSATACVLATEGVGVALTDPFTLAMTDYPELTMLSVRPRIPITAQLLISREMPCSRLALHLVEAVRTAAREMSEAVNLATAAGFRAGISRVAACSIP